MDQFQVSEEQCSLVYAGLISIINEAINLCDAKTFHLPQKHYQKVNSDI